MITKLQLHVDYEDDVDFDENIFRVIFKKLLLEKVTII